MTLPQTHAQPMLGPTATSPYHKRSEVARMLGVCERTVSQAVKAGLLRETRLAPKRVGYLADDVREYVAKMNPERGAATGRGFPPLA